MHAHQDFALFGSRAFDLRDFERVRRAESVANQSFHR
jgi:hypothetical protein